jgi:hypothetical protein
MGEEMLETIVSIGKPDSALHAQVHERCCCHGELSKAEGPALISKSKVYDHATGNDASP